MKQNTKQRIVGTVVLIAVALIFLPLIFDGEGSYQQPISSRIPQPPLVAVLPDQVQTRPEIAADRDVVPFDQAEPDIPIPDTDNNATAEQQDPPQQANNADAANPVEPIPVADPISGVSTVPVTDSVPDIVRQPALDARGLPQGWSVRLGTFSDSANAVKLMERLRTGGYKAYTRNMSNQERTLTGVFVGPWVDRARVEEYRQNLQQEFQLAGIVVRFEVDGP